MPTPPTVQDAIAAHYDGLSRKLQLAADYIVENPVDVATRSLRSIAGTSGVSPATYSRLARALGYDTYEELRETCRRAFGRHAASFSEKARKLQCDAHEDHGGSLLARQSAACIVNIETQLRVMDQTRLEAVATLLADARQVLLVGGLASAGVVDYFAYLASWFTENWRVAGRNGTALSAALSGIGPGDAVVVLLKTPYAKRSIHAARIAASAGASVIVITDSHTSPALKHASHSLIVPTESPQFFSSYTATLALIETIIGMLVTRAGPEAEQRIQAVEALNHDLEEFWPTPENRAYSASNGSRPTDE